MQFCCTYNWMSQSPVVEPVAACVRCSNESSVSSLTVGTRFWSNFWKISSALLFPSYNNGIPWRKKTTDGSFLGLYNRTNWLLMTFTTSAGKFSLKSSRTLNNSFSYLSQSAQFFLAEIEKKIEYFWIDLSIYHRYTYKIKQWQIHSLWYVQPNHHPKSFQKYYLLRSIQSTWL